MWKMNTTDTLQALLALTDNATRTWMVAIEIASEGDIDDLREKLASVNPMTVVSEPNQTAEEPLVFVDWPKMKPHEQATLMQRILDYAEFQRKVVVFPLYPVEPTTKMDENRNLPRWFLCRVANIPADF